MHRLRNYILCVVVTILLFFTVTAVQGSLFAKYYVLNTDTYVDVIEEKDIGTKVYEVIEERYETEVNSTGIPSEVYMEVVNNPAVKEMVTGCVEDAFKYIKGKAKKLDYETCREKLVPLKKSIDTFFEEYANSINYEKDDAFYEKTSDVYETADKFITETADVYQFITIDAAGYLRYAKKVYDYIDIMMIVSIIASFVLIIIIIIANNKNLFNSFYWISISAGTSAVIFLAVCIYLKVTDYFDRFAIKAKHVFAAMTGLFNELTDKLITINLIIISISFVLMILYIVLGKEKNVTDSQNKEVLQEA